MKKIITIAIIATILALAVVKANALPKVTVLDIGCGNTPEYVENTLKSNNLEYADDQRISKELSKYIGMFKFGTFLIEENDEKAIISIFNGKPIFGARVRSSSNK